MENELDNWALAYFRKTPEDDRRRALGSALLGMVEGSGDCDKTLANMARRYAQAFKIVEQEENKQ